MLEKLHNQEDRFDVTLQLQGSDKDGNFAVMAKIETLEVCENSLRTKRKVSVSGVGKTAKAAQNNALKEAIKLLGL